MTESADTLPQAPAPRIVLVTGPSGAGRSTAIRALEDLGYEVIDNLPLSLVPRLLEGSTHGPALALGIDTRNRDFSTGAFLDLINSLDTQGAELLYLDCRPEVLLRRYSETRRRHPLAPAENPAVGIERDFDLLGPIQQRADIVIDTSELTIHDTRAEISRWFGGAPKSRLAVSVQSFSYKRGLPRGLDMVFDCRFLRNPYWKPDLRGLDGLSPAVADYVAGDARFEDFFGKVLDLAMLLLPAYVEEGKSYLSIGFGCTGGQHRSVTMAERLGNALAEAGWQVSIRHRELEQLTEAGGSAGQTRKKT
ncbi:RNase adapter RapZ [Tropicimonas sp. IMCC6043]|uniref:RNase adapter RapZ n=1 Tax=Tropicimonas sp. IMCC6043 TaxID=2510645 RepID=UPI00101BDDB6|nr:RNase adapter RapZ [Tropicimonas sp. IMCC6043]RYH11758.1 RNase adapter RapZ [Tropicimonas sp. IMCC6043]